MRSQWGIYMYIRTATHKPSSLTHYPNQNNLIFLQSMEPDSDSQIETKKKKRKKRHEKIRVLDEHQDTEPDSETHIETEKKKKKKKRKKLHAEVQVLQDELPGRIRVLDEHQDTEPDIETHIETEKEKKKKKKKEKRKKPDTEVQVLRDEQPDTEVQVLQDEQLDTKPDNEIQIETEEEEGEELHAKIQVVQEHPDKTAPLVGYFPSGFDPDNRHEPPRVRAFRNKNQPKRVQLVVSPNGSKVDFVGTSYSGAAATGQVCTYALGVLDKETQTLKIVPIASNKIFRLEPRVGGSDSSDKEPSSLLQEEHTAETMENRIRELTQLYGTKKSITRAKKSDALKQKVDASSEQNLDRKMKKVVINKEALESAAAPTARNIPPYDSSATTPQQAYPLDKIILNGEWDYLLDILELSQVGAEVAPDSYPSFVYNRIHKLGEIEDEVEKQQLACIFSYINHLVKFKDQHSLDGSSSAKNHKIPRILRQKFSTMFADSASKWLSAEKNALLISYVLVLTLFADGFRTDLSDIARDLKMSQVKLRTHFEHLGCKFKHENKLLLATLPVPLQFPQLRQKRRR